MKTLHLVLTRKWFDMILANIKKEEYRKLTNYWLRRLTGHVLVDKIGDSITIKPSKSDIYSALSQNADIINESNDWLKFDSITFSHGYKTDRDQFEIEFKGIEIREGKSEWGAVPGTKYFTLKTGEILRLNKIKKPNILNYPQFAIGDYHCDEDDYKTELNKILNK